MNDCKDNIQKIAYCYVAALFSFYPLIFSPLQGYYALGSFKFRIWAVLTVSLIACAAWSLFGKRATAKPPLSRYSATWWLDVSFIIFSTFATISFAMAQNKVLVLVGRSGWYTGLLFQFGIVLAYFIVSRNVRFDCRLMYIIIATAMVIFALGIAHRFYIDPVGIMKTLSPKEHVRFLSTIGQATWYSSYLCVVFPVGLYGFIWADKLWEKIISGLFLMLSAATLVTQNSDSAYLGVGVAGLCFLFYAVHKGRPVVMRMGIGIVIMSLAVVGIGCLERIVGPDGMVPLDELSLKIAQGFVPFAGLCFGLVLVLLALNEKFYGFVGKRLLIIGIVGFVVAAVCGAIYLISGSAHDVYFVWGHDWGNGRGLIWTRTLEMYRDLPLYRKLFGIGPGCFSEYISPYTDLVLANAHNEWLTMFVELGIFGGLAYLMIFVMAVVMGLKMISSESKSSSASCPDTSLVSSNLGIVIVAAVLAYFVHNFFNYQQCIATPLLITLIAVNGDGSH